MGRIHRYNMDNVLIETCNGAMCLADLKADEGQKPRETDATILWEALRLVALTKQEARHE